MIEIIIEDGDRLDWALKAFKKKIQRAGVLRDLRKKRYYEKPSEARARKAAAAKRRGATRGRPRTTGPTKTGGRNG
jgi:small subunit ribosomal protein S21